MLSLSNLMITVFIIAILAAGVFYFIKRRKRINYLNKLNVGDIVTLVYKFKVHYPQLPLDNPFTVVGFEKSNVIIKYIHFKKITIHHETVRREAIRKIS